MSWRNLALDLVAWFASLIIKTYVLALRIYSERWLLREPLRPEGPVIAALWHGHMLIPLVIFRDRPVTVLVSRSRDGERLARVARHFGLGSVRGSTSRGAATAMKELLELAHQNTTHIVVTPDGPRGPCHQVAPGVTYLAQKTGFPILPLAVGVDRYWVLPSKWDEFLLPKPFARVLVRRGKFHWVPAELSEEELEECRRRLEEDMQTLTAIVYDRARRPEELRNPELTVAH